MYQIFNFKDPQAICQELAVHIEGNILQPETLLSHILLLSFVKSAILRVLMPISLMSSIMKLFG